MSASDTCVLWRGLPYLARPYEDAPEFLVLTDVYGATFFVPESETEDGLKAVVSWTYNEEIQSAPKLFVARAMPFFRHSISCSTAGLPA